jgi:hypothetical protein
MSKNVLVEDEAGGLVLRKMGGFLGGAVAVVARRTRDGHAVTTLVDAIAADAVSLRTDGALRLADGWRLELDPIELDIR